jgi:hypothetical protein
VGKKAPSAPDPYATAQAQGAMNADTARTQARLNRGNTYTPFGTVTNRDLGAEWLETQNLDARREAARASGQFQDGRGDGFSEEAFRKSLASENPYQDQWRTDVTLSPEQQGLYRQGVELDTRTGQLALDMLPEAQRALMAPMATDDPDARRRATEGLMSRMEPQFERDRAAMDSRLIAQGFQPGTEAYNRAADELSRARTDARFQAETLGLSESRNAANFSNAQRAQRINELGMLFGLGPGMQVPQAQQMMPSNIAAPDLAGLIMNNYNQQSANARSNTTAMAQVLGSIFGAAGTAAGAGAFGKP